MFSINYTILNECKNFTRFYTHTQQTKKQRKNPNDPARFIGNVAVTDDGEAAKVHSFLNESKINDEAQYDGLYAVCTDLLDDDVKDILKVSEGRWQIEECFRIMKTDFAARPVYLQDENRIKAHFLICFLALLSFLTLQFQTFLLLFLSLQVLCFQYIPSKTKIQVSLIYFSKVPQSKAKR